MFFLLLFSIWIAVLAHIFWRTQGLLGLRGRLRAAFGALLLLLAFAFIPGRVLIALGRAEWFGTALTHAGAWAIAAIVTVWSLLVLFEVGAALVWFLGRRRVRDATLRTKRAMGAVLWGTTAVLMVWGFTVGHSTPRVTTLRLNVPGAEARRFVVISDTHLGAISSEGQWRRTLERARDLQPDALLIPGDLIDDLGSRTEPQAALLREVFPETPVYVTTGNHEFYAGADRFADLCDRLGLRLLRQEAVALSPGLTLAGIDDGHFVGSREAIEEVRPKMEGPAILMAHRPAAARFLADRPETLVLSGHTHGGQTLPTVFLVQLGNAGFHSGYYRIGQADLYVSRGAGVWGPPIRIRSLPEMVLIEVRPGRQFRVEDR